MTTVMLTVYVIVSYGGAIAMVIYIGIRFHNQMFVFNYTHDNVILYLQL